MNSWSYNLAAYLLSAVGLLWYLVSVGRRVRTVMAQVMALKHQRIVSSCESLVSSSQLETRNSKPETLSKDRAS